MGKDNQSHHLLPRPTPLDLYSLEQQPFCSEENKHHGRQEDPGSTGHK